MAACARSGVRKKGCWLPPWTLWCFSIVFGVTSGLFVGVLAGVAGILVLLFFFAYYIVVEAIWGADGGRDATRHPDGSGEHGKAAGARGESP